MTLKNDSGSSGSGYGLGATAFDVIGNMLTSMGATANHADVNATILKLLTQVFSIASTRFALVGMAFNTVEWLRNPNWQDAGQVALSFFAVTAFGMTAPGWVMLGAGVVLSGWELYEAYNEARKSGSSGGGY
ncbi:hypothetical protein ACFRAE_17215 [Sphingobacterium sp. HJSM2_6]